MKARRRNQYSGVCTIDDQVFGGTEKEYGLPENLWAPLRAYIIQSLDWQQGRQCFDGTKDVVVDVGRLLGIEFDDYRFSIHGSKVTIRK